VLDFALSTSNASWCHLPHAIKTLAAVGQAGISHSRQRIDGGDSAERIPAISVLGHVGIVFELVGFSRHCAPFERRPRSIVIDADKAGRRIGGVARRT